MKSNLIKGIIVALFWISTIVTINASDSCDKAEKLNANVSGANVSLTWSGKSTSYVIEVENKTTNQVVVPESNAASPFVLTLANGSYKFKVRSICAKTKSDWSDWFNFNVNNVSTPPATTPAGGNGSDDSKNGSEDNNKDNKSDTTKSSGGGSSNATCGTPTMLAFTVSDNDVKLSWNSDAPGFQMELENESNDSAIINEKTVSNPFITTLPDGNYKFKVRAICGSNHSDWSTELSFVVGTPTIKDSGEDTTKSDDKTKSDTAKSSGSGKPSATCSIPTSLAFTVSGNDVKLSWVSDASSFQMELENQTKDSSILNEVSVANPFITTLPDGKYKFKVRAICDKSKSNWSEFVSFTVGVTGATAPPITDNGSEGSDDSKGDSEKKDSSKAKKDTVCGKNLVVSVIHSSDSTITISWNKVSNAAFYHVEIESEQVTPEFHLDKEHILDTTLTLTGLIPGIQYKVEVRAHCGNYDSTRVDSLMTITPQGSKNNSGGGTSKFTCDVPTGLSVKADSANLVIQWVSTGASLYQIRIESEENTPAFNKTIDVKNNFFELNFSLPQGKYKARVRGICTFNNSDWSGAIRFTLVKDIVKAFQLENRSKPKLIDIRAFPNPAHDFVNIKLISPFMTDGILQVINQLGQVIIKTTINHEMMDMRLNTSGLLPGMYFIKLDAGNAQSIERILIQ